LSFEEWTDVFLWRCDQCGKEVMFKPHDFMSCVAELKARHWSFHHNDDGTWDHSCGQCNHKHQQTSIMDRTIKSVK
jgi:DNA-directed RNA polymerase subunit RPC12/RpoP